MNTRVDSAFTVQWLSRQLKKPTLEHLKAAKSLFSYYNRTKMLSICYSRNKNPYPIGFADSDFAGDKKDSKSTYGYIIQLAGGPISWKSKKSSTIALSTLEAEYKAITEGIREIQWLTGLFSEISRPLNSATILYSDNKGAISTAKDPTLHSRTKHTLLHYNYTRELVKKGVVKIDYLKGDQIVADGLTKPLPIEKFNKFIKFLGLEIY